MCALIITTKIIAKKIWANPKLKDLCNGVIPLPDYEILGKKSINEDNRLFLHLGFKKELKLNGKFWQFCKKYK